MEFLPWQIDHAVDKSRHGLGWMGSRWKGVFRGLFRLFPWCFEDWAQQKPATYHVQKVSQSAHGVR